LNTSSLLVKTNREKGQSAEKAKTVLLKRVAKLDQEEHGKKETTKQVNGGEKGGKKERWGKKQVASLCYKQSRSLGQLEQEGKKDGLRGEKKTRFETTESLFLTQSKDDRRGGGRART